MRAKANTARETTTTSGTGTLTLAGAAPGPFVTFAEAGITNGKTVGYRLAQGSDVEVGVGTWSTGGQLARGTVLISKIGGVVGTSKINLSAAGAFVDQVTLAEDFAAAEITFTPAGNIAATDVQAALVEVDAEKVAGPASVTDGLPALFDGTTGKLIKAVAFSVFKTALALVKGDVGLGNVDNTSDASKPVSSATQSALDAKAPINAPTFTTSVTLPGDPASALQAATKQYVDGLAANLGRRARVRAGTTGNVTISTALNNGDSLDGITLATGDWVLVKDQSSPADNGVYEVGAVPARVAEFDSFNEHPGSLIAVAEGTANADTLWLCTSNAGGTLGSTAIAFSKMVIAGELLAANNLGDVASAATAFANIKQAATDTATGVVELATTTEVQTGTDTLRAVTPAGVRAATREKLSASRTYYVRTDGNDGNTGLVDSSGGAFLTIQKAIDTAAGLDLSIYSVTIQIGNGTYTQALNLKSFVGGGTITLRGDPTTPSNVVINPTAATCIQADNVAGIWVVRGVKLTATTSGNGILATGISNLLPYEIEFGAVGSSSYHMMATRGAVIYPQSNYTISGGAYAHMFADTGALIQNVNKTVTLSGTFAFSYFARSGRAGTVQASGLTFSGTYTVTGPRYLGQFNGIIDVAGGGASYFPGDSVGSLATGAQYG